MSGRGAIPPITVLVFGPGSRPEGESQAGIFMTGFGSEERLPAPVMEKCHGC